MVQTLRELTEDTSDSESESVAEEASHSVEAKEVAAETRTFMRLLRDHMESLHPEKPLPIPGQNGDWRP